jgi:hypothetical protein
LIRETVDRLARRFDNESPFAPAVTDHQLKESIVTNLVSGRFIAPLARRRRHLLALRGLVVRAAAPRKGLRGRSRPGDDARLWS